MRESRAPLRSAPHAASSRVGPPAAVVRLLLLATLAGARRLGARGDRRADRAPRRRAPRGPRVAPPRPRQVRERRPRRRSSTQLRIVDGLELRRPAPRDREGGDRPRRRSAATSTSTTSPSGSCSTSCSSRTGSSRRSRTTSSSSRRKADALGPPVFALYDVRHLTWQKTDFHGPDLDLPPVGLRRRRTERPRSEARPPSRTTRSPTRSTSSTSSRRWWTTTWDADGWSHHRDEDVPGRQGAAIGAAPGRARAIGRMAELK